jgi:type VI secretion system protein ImpF
MFLDPTAMANAFGKDRLQPSLFDRLNDELATASIQLDQDSNALFPLLDDAQKQALSALLADERLEKRPPSAESLLPFGTLGEEGRLLLDRIISAEIFRRRQTRRSTMLTAAELRMIVLRDLQNLLNTTAAEADFDGEDKPLGRWPSVQSSVLNYGIPALAGKVRTADDVLELAWDIERAVECFEPRVRLVRVRVSDAVVASGHVLSSPLELIIEGELWGYPVAEYLQVHTVLDLDAGHAEVTGTERQA